MFQILRQPYPIYLSKRQHLKSALLAGAFVALFLILFQPFGLHSWLHPQKWLMLSIYGLITVAIMLLWRLIRLRSQHHKKDEQWTLGKEVLSIFLLISSIGLANWLYSSYLGLAQLNSRHLLNYMGMTFLIGIFPSIFIPLFNYILKLKQHSQRSLLVNQQLKASPGPQDDRENLISLSSENGKDIFYYQHNHIYFIQSTDNYATIFHLSPEHSGFKKSMIRSSLNRLEGQLSQTSIKRCHRSYLVNLALVDSVSGNAQGYRLHLSDELESIPLSRKYAPSILAFLEQKSPK